jgi:asparagine synthase (glutamine-hydrolysing)
MCGICGIMNHKDGGPVSRALLEKMTGVLSHRGPDSHGIHIDRAAGLGHRRLAIIDRTSLGNQPMSNEDGSIWLVFDGEIYNFRSLRQQLEGKHTFRSQSDTEVIIHLYEEYGEDCIEHLRGMFAFALWDGTEEKLFMARDRLGQKFIYYTSGPERFLFASEIKSLLQDHGLTRVPNLNALHDYLSLSYAPGAETAFKNIYRIPPAHKLVYQKGKLTLSRYWQLSYAAASGRAPGPGQVKEEIIEKLTESVSLRLMSEVPLGAFLSGGIDSSSVVALMMQLTGRPVKTFSIGFNEKSHDESHYARMVSRALGTEHYEYTLSPYITSILPEVIEQYDEPFADPSAIPTYYLAKMAKQHVTVALNGDGGDENFAGYDRYVKSKLALYYHWLPSPLRRSLTFLFSRLVPGSLPHDNILGRLREFFSAGDMSLAEMYCRWLFFFNRYDKVNLYTDAFSSGIDTEDTEEMIERLIHSSDGKDFTEAAVHTDVLTYLPGDLLIKMDRATMAHALESRSPFLDHTFMEYVAALPSRFKLQGLSRKWILKEAAGTLLPDEIIRRPKRGFGIPVDQWLRTQLRDAVYDILMSRSSRDRGYFKESAVEELLKQHMSGERNWQFHLWNLLVLELWHQRFIDLPAGSLS